MNWAWAKVPTTALTHEARSANDRITYVALCIFANRDGLCYPSRATLMKYTGLSPRALTRSVANLCREGIISATGRAGTSSLYKVASIATQAIPTAAAQENAAGGIATQAIHDSVINTSVAEIIEIFNKALPRHGIGNAREVAQIIKKSGHAREWYIRLFREVSKRPFLCGQNDKNIYFPLSFLLREAKSIIDGKYLPWQETAAAAAEYIQQGGI